MWLTDNQPTCEVLGFVCCWWMVDRDSLTRTTGEGTRSSPYLSLTAFHRVLALKGDAHVVGDVVTDVCSVQITYLNSVVMPDEAESESEEEDDDDDEEGEGDSAESSEAGDDDEAE